MQVDIYKPSEKEGDGLEYLTTIQLDGAEPLPEEFVFVAENRRVVYAKREAS